GCPSVGEDAARWRGTCTGHLDVNTAASEDLLQIPGIGPVLAQRIIDRRPFNTADALIDVAGIGPKRYEQIRPHFR
ncbi:MAG TPA: helix-hairpin-helix domain-containing protein, partial [Chthoniobacterales bacterium]|nr:helix-hairpin-helix domain-containing protein [Chthoniobacterales bacterium]